MAWGVRYREGKVARPMREHYIKLSGVETYLWTDREGNTHLKLHNTVVASFNDQWITLRTGGWDTKLTRGRIEWASQNFDLGFSIYRDHGDTFVEFHGRWPFDGNKLSLNRQTFEVVEGDKVEIYTDLDECKRQKRSFRPQYQNGAMPDEQPADDIDVELDDQGSIILFKLASKRAREWWSEHVSEGPMFGRRYVVEPRYAPDIVEGMINDGLNVR